MPSHIIEVNQLSKIYKVNERESGLMSSLKSFIKRKTKDVHAVNQISFNLDAGEVVGFIGPNGAGKTTTLKMLSGLLHPTGGKAEVLGFTPWNREKDYLRQITLVMGQRQQLIWDIPAMDSFELNRSIYQIPQKDYRMILDELVGLLDLNPILHKPVRNLSLGERMKCEIAASLLHRPRVVFLDEPTIGLDVTMQRRIRQFIGEYNRRFDATVLLTSHYMGDVEALCKRVIVIHSGEILYDGDLSSLVQKFTTHKIIQLKLDSCQQDLSIYGDVIECQDGRVTLRVRREKTAQVTGRLLNDLPVIDLLVEDPSLEETIDLVFNK